MKTKFMLDKFSETLVSKTYSVWIVATTAMFTGHLAWEGWVVISCFYIAKEAWLKSLIEKYFEKFKGSDEAMSYPTRY